MESRSQDGATRACRQRRLPGDSTNQQQGDPKGKTHGHTLEETKNDQRTYLNSPTIRCQFPDNSLPLDLYHSKLDRSSGTDDPPVFRRLSPLSGRGYPTEGREAA